MHAGLAYDAFGRTTTLPAADAGGSTAGIGYYLTDMVATQTQGTATRSWTLDPAGQLRAAAASGNPTRTNHYGGGGDSPTWIDENTGATTLTATRYVAGLDGNLAAEIAHSGTATTARWQLVNLHGDIVTTATDTTTLTTPDGATLDADEYGQPISTTTPRYGWLGGKQRSTDSLAGLILMGVRLYTPTLGRFLQTDPEPGGSANDYDYANQDPVNAYDLDGRWPCFRCAKRWVARKWNDGSIARWTSYGAAATCFVAIAACGVASAVAWGVSAASRTHRFVRTRGYRSRSAWGTYLGGMAGDVPFWKHARAVRGVRHRYLSRHGGWYRHRTLKYRWSGRTRRVTVMNATRNVGAAAWARWGL